VDGSQIFCIGLGGSVEGVAELDGWAAMQTAISIMPGEFCVPEVGEVGGGEALVCEFDGENAGDCEKDQKGLFHF
jgi:hypothetical protein